MREIALDTQAATAVAILEDGRVTGRAHNDSVRHHAESITPLVRDALAAADLPPVLAEAGIDRILVGTGPAPFTGLRSGLVSARVLARVAGVPTYGVCSLDVIARQGLDLLARDMRVYAIADARRRELYWGSYVAAGPNDVTSKDASKSVTSPPCSPPCTAHPASWSPERPSPRTQPRPWRASTSAPRSSLTPPS